MVSVPNVIFLALTALLPADTFAVEDVPTGEHKLLITSAGNTSMPPFTMGVGRIEGDTWMLTVTPSKMQIVNPTGSKETGAADQGHAVLSLDGKAPVSFFSQTYELALTPGTHEVAVHLVTNDGHTYPRVERRLFVRVPNSKNETFAKPKTFDLAIPQRKDSASPDTIRVSQGDTVELNWSSDEAMELHMHGYDIKARVSADSIATILFNADVAGRFNIESHGKNEHVLLYVEVYPK